MSKHTRQFIEQLKSPEPPSPAQPTLLESIKDAAASLRDAGGQLWDAAKPMCDHGRTELAAALFSGHAHVMYMKGQEAHGQSHDQEKDPQHQQPEQNQPTPERESPGREV